jgi:hypothetical protein
MYIDLSGGFCIDFFGVTGEIASVTRNILDGQALTAILFLALEGLLFYCTKGEEEIRASSSLFTVLSIAAVRASFVRDGIKVDLSLPGKGEK